MIYGCGFEFDLGCVFCLQPQGEKLSVSFLRGVISITPFILAIFSSLLIGTWHDIPKMAQEIMVKKKIKDELGEQF